MSGAYKWCTEDNLMLIECWTRDGYTQQMLADRIGITRVTLMDWRKQCPEIEEAMARGKEVVDYKVENALLKSALGYTTEDVKTIISGQPDKDGNRNIRIEKTTKEVAPNTTAIAIWLNNRKPEQWKRNRDNVLEMKDEDSRITVNIVRHSAEDAATTAKPNDDEESWDVEEQEIITDNKEYFDGSKQDKNIKQPTVQPTSKAKESTNKESSILSNTTNQHSVNKQPKTNTPKTNKNSKSTKQDSQQGNKRSGSSNTSFKGSIIKTSTEEEEWLEEAGDY